jgi:hypothetical protein
VKSACVAQILIKKMDKTKKTSKFQKRYLRIIILVLILISLIIFLNIIFPPWDSGSPRCLFDGPIKCSKFKITGDDGNGHCVVKFKAVNKAEEIANFSFIAVGYFPDEVKTVPCAVSPTDGINIKPEQAMEVNCVFNETLSAKPGNTKTKFDISVNGISDFGGIVYGKIE